MKKHHREKQPTMMKQQLVEEKQTENANDQGSKQSPELQKYVAEVIAEEAAVQEENQTKEGEDEEEIQIDEVALDKVVQGVKVHVQENKSFPVGSTEKNVKTKQRITAKTKDDTTYSYDTPNELKEEPNKRKRLVKKGDDVPVQ